VLDELIRIVEQHRPQRIIFRDPVFGLDADRVASLCHLILATPSLKPGKSLKWECESRPEHFCASLLRLMSLAGCIGIKAGLETVSTDLLARHGRVSEQEIHNYLSSAQALAKDCTRFGIACRAYVMVGLPGQTEEMAQETARFVQEMRPTSLTIKPFVSYPGLCNQDAPELDAAELEAQMRPLIAVQHHLRQHPQARPSRWRRAFWRMSYRAKTLVRGEAP
jgi:radical SAM superfamily enzyme YgiQ (UPF0313 family)